MKISDKDGEYLAIIEDVLSEVEDNDMDFQYPQSRLAVAMCIIDRLRKKPKKELKSEYYLSNDIKVAFGKFHNTNQHYFK